MGSFSKLFVFFFSFFFSFSLFASINLTGIITDAGTGETLPGVSVAVKNTTKGTISDFDGKYQLNLVPGTYSLSISYMSYATIELTDVEILENKITHLNIPMEESAQALKEVVVVSMRRMNSEVAVLSTVRNATSVVSAISAQQISKNQDSNASEVIRRVPGISIIEDRFIVTRGLAQRYNNVWINNSAAPSSESDTRAFSFDIIPGSQLDNIMVVKSPQPELPADFSGGFVQISTKSVPSQNSMELSYGMGFNSQTQFQNFKYNKGAWTDILGFDNGMRQLRSSVSKRLDNSDKQQVLDATKNGFNEDWKIKTKNPLPDQRLNFVLNRKFNTPNNQMWGLTAAFNYSNSNKTQRNMENSRYGVYNRIEKEPVYMNKYTDNQYTSELRTGAIANLVFVMSDNNKFEFRNILNHLTKDRYTERDGFQNISSLYKQEKKEYLYNSRLTYSAQLAGKHTFSKKNELDWTGGFAYANRNQPDRRMVERDENTNPADDEYLGGYHINQNEISRDFIKLNEYVYSFGSNYKHEFEPKDDLKLTLKTGVYGEYKERENKNRFFNYRYINKNLPEDFAYRDVVDEILISENYSADKLYIYEDTDNRNSYLGVNKLIAGYLAANLPLGDFNVYTGVRAEYNEMTLVSNTMIKGDRIKSVDYPTFDLFPSLNATYNINTDNLVRIAYGRSTNRQEFREVSASVYEDFELFSSIKGNPELKPAYIQNFDLRYEFYPTAIELVSVALFYKNFKNPIEWIYHDAGGSYIFSFENANVANNYGIEVDVKKNLDFIGMKNFSFNFNGALIRSLVRFDEKSLEHDRPMQGQSPYLINTGLFYQNEKLGLTTGLLYNVIGPRIVGIGRVETNDDGSTNNDIPDMYEMPRNVIDFTFAKKWKQNFEISLGLRDILAQDVAFKQFPKFKDDGDKIYQREQTTKRYNPGRNFRITAKYIF